MSKDITSELLQELMQKMLSTSELMQELIIQEESGHILVYDFAFQRFNGTQRVNIPLQGRNGQPVQLLITPDGSMLLQLEHESDLGWLLTSYLLDAAGTRSMLSIARDHEPLPDKLRKLSQVGPVAARATHCHSRHSSLFCIGGCVAGYPR